MKKKQHGRNLYIDLCNETLFAMTKLLAHHADDIDFGGEELGRIKYEYKPLIAKLTDKAQRERCIDELNSFEAWVVTYRKKIIDKYNQGEYR